MKYFKLLFDYAHDSDVVFCTLENPGNLDRTIVQNGSTIENWTIPRFQVVPGSGTRFTDYLANDLGWFIVSPRLRALLTALAPDAVQYLPVRLRNELSGEVEDTYSAANIVDSADALDLDNSKYSILKVGDCASVLSVSVYSLKASVLKGHSIFRLKASPGAIFVSEDVRAAIKRQNISGCDFGRVRMA